MRLSVEGTQLKVIPAKTINELLALPEDDTHSRNFIMVNSICFFADDMPCIACIDAKFKLDTSQLAILSGVSRRKIKLASAVECELIYGFTPGTVPPFRHRSIKVQGKERRIPIYADVSLRNADYLVAGGGAHETFLWVSSASCFELIDVAQIGDISLVRGAAAIARPQPKPDQDNLDKTNEERTEFRFLADSMVARVGKWLRTMGLDVVVWDPYALPKKTERQDHKQSLLALAEAERIVLTRDKKLAHRRDAGACFVVASDDPYQQFQEIKAHFALELKEDEMMTRCARCNAKALLLVDAEYFRTQTEDFVHANVLEIVQEFWSVRNVTRYSGKVPNTAQPTATCSDNRDGITTHPILLNSSSCFWKWFNVNQVYNIEQLVCTVKPGENVLIRLSCSVDDVQKGFVLHTFTARGRIHREPDRVLKECAGEELAVVRTEQDPGELGVAD